MFFAILATQLLTFSKEIPMACFAIERQVLHFVMVFHYHQAVVFNLLGNCRLQDSKALTGGGSMGLQLEPKQQQPGLPELVCMVASGFASTYDDRHSRTLHAQERTLSRRPLQLICSAVSGSNRACDAGFKIAPCEQGPSCPLL